MSDFRVSAKIDEKTFRLIEDVAAEREVSRAEALRTVLTRYGYTLQIRELKLEPTRKHYSILGATESGKTFLTRHYLIPRLEQGRKVVVVDPHGEYDDGYETIPFTYKGTIAHTTNQLVQAMQIQAMSDKITDLIDGLIERIGLSKRKRISIRVNIANAKADGIIISQFLEQLTQREEKWNPPLLVVVEEAASYDCLPLVRRGRHYGIQAILLSQDPLSGKTRTNTRTITGANDPTITKKIDPSIAFAAQQLHQGEFLWEPVKGQWNRFKYTARK